MVTFNLIRSRTPDCPPSNILDGLLIVFKRDGTRNTCKVGDWTQELFHLGLEQPRLPLWITAAQPSLMEKSIYYDNSKGVAYLMLHRICLGVRFASTFSCIREP